MTRAPTSNAFGSNMRTVTWSESRRRRRSVRRRGGSPRGCGCSSRSDTGCRSSPSLISSSVGMRRAREQRDGRHDLAALAVTALRHVAFDPRLLHRMSDRWRRALRSSSPFGLARWPPAFDTTRTATPPRCTVHAPQAPCRSRIWCRSASGSRAAPTAAACRLRRRGAIGLAVQRNSIMRVSNRRMRCTQWTVARRLRQLVGRSPRHVQCLISGMSSPTRSM